MIDLSDNNQFYIFPVADLHLGSCSFNKKLFKQWESDFNSVWDNKCIYLLGDLIEFPTTRVNAYDSNMSTSDMVNQIIDMFEPYKEYIRMVCTGNHEARGLKDFNLDVTKIIAQQLNVPYTRNDFFDVLYINENKFIIYGKHGVSTSKYPDLAMKNFKIDMGNIDANLYLQGHNHYLEFSKKYQRDYDGGYLKHYCFAGHYLNYKDSYAHDKGLTVSPPGYMRLGVNRALNVTNKTVLGVKKV